jgi:hypothetical protein
LTFHIVSPKWRRLIFAPRGRGGYVPTYTVDHWWGLHQDDIMARKACLSWYWEPGHCTSRGATLPGVRRGFSRGAKLPQSFIMVSVLTATSLDM